jgi:hypothetical protein
MSRGRSAARDHAGAVHRHATYVITSTVGVTYICHGPDSRPRGAPPAQQAPGELEGPGQPNPPPGPESMSTEFACDAKRIGNGYNMLAST